MMCNTYTMWTKLLRCFLITTTSRNNGFSKNKLDILQVVSPIWWKALTNGQFLKAVRTKQRALSFSFPSKFMQKHCMADVSIKWNNNWKIISFSHYSIYIFIMHEDRLCMLHRKFYERNWQLCEQLGTIVAYLLFVKVGAKDCCDK